MINGEDEMINGEDEMINGEDGEAKTRLVFKSYNMRTKTKWTKG